MSTLHTPNQPHSTRTREPRVLLEDLTAGLLWPTLLKAPAMAFAPPRWLLGTVCAFVVILVSSLHQYLFNTQQSEAAIPHSQGFESLLASMMSLNPSVFVERLAHTGRFYTLQLTESPWISAALLLPILLTLGVFGFAITRSASIQYAHGRHTDTIGALSAALLNIRQTALTTLGPLLMCAILALLVMILGLPLGLPVVNILGGVFYILALIISILIAGILTLHILTLPLSISALAIEGTDGFDALQRAYAYLIAKPIRLGLYTLILVILGTTITTVVATLAGWSIELADALTSTLTNDAGRRVLIGAEDMSATEPLAHWIIALARAALQLIVAGYVLSLLFCSSTLAYLNIRRVCDGQDINEVWDPAE
jgi:hypothetical protein